MLIRIGFEIEIRCDGRVPMITALSTHQSNPGRLIGQDVVRTDPSVPTREYHDKFGNRMTRLAAPGGPLRLWSDCVMETPGHLDPVERSAHQHDIEELPDDVLQFLVPSRYCDSDNLMKFAWSQFGGAPLGWQRVQAVADYVHSEVTFGYKFGRSNKTASEVHLEKTGVCRDFAHLSIALCRALNIPARYVSGYLGDILVPYSGPGDFCAWFEVFLGGHWYTFDARYNVPRAGRIPMVRGADAADVAMITSFGSHSLTFFRVWADRLQDGLDDATLHRMLSTRPKAEPLVFPSSGRAA